MVTLITVMAAQLLSWVLAEWHLIGAASCSIWIMVAVRACQRLLIKLCWTEVRHAALSTSRDANSLRHWHLLILA